MKIHKMKLIINDNIKIIMGTFVRLIDFIELKIKMKSYNSLIFVLILFVLDILLVTFYPASSNTFLNSINCYLILNFNIHEPSIISKIKV